MVLWLGDKREKGSAVGRRRESEEGERKRQAWWCASIIFTLVRLRQEDSSGPAWATYEILLQKPKAEGTVNGRTPV